MHWRRPSSRTLAASRDCGEARERADAANTDVRLGAQLGQDAKSVIPRLAATRAWHGWREGEQYQRQRKRRCAAGENEAKQAAHSRP
jgi:hypothetical protein